MWSRPRRTTRNASAAGLAKVRMVDITAQAHQIARQDMIRLSDENPQDPVALQRRLACDTCEKDPLRREQCYRASAGHPNPFGAEDYARAIVTALA